MNGFHPVAAIEGNFKADPFRRAAADALNLVAERFGLGLPVNAARIAEIKAAVERAYREAIPYSISSIALELRLHPALVQARRDVEMIEKALKEGEKKGWQAIRVTKERLKEALPIVRERATQEEQAAVKSQTELDVDMCQALARVTTQGKTTGLAIGNWFAKIAGTVVDDKMLTIDKSNPERRVNQVIIEKI